jgi:hypothetical protein
LVNNSITISGITTGQLKKHIKAAKPALNGNFPVVLFIGTNDIVRNTSINDLKNQFLSLIKLIRKFYAPELLLILALPAFPRYLNQDEHLARIDTINQFLATLQSDSTHLLRLPMTIQNTYTFFHQHYEHSRRVDKIHLNDKAFIQLTKIIKQTVMKFSNQN